MKRLVSGLALLALTACGEAKAPETVATPPPPAGPAVKLYAMDCGRFTVKEAASFSDDGAYKGQKRDLVDPCYLIRSEKGDLLWDTGIPSAVAAVSPVEDDGSITTLTKTLEQQLAELNVTPADIEFVSFSHLHFDHTGNGNTFAGSTWIVDKDERDAMFSDAARKGEDFKQYGALEAAKTVLIEGEGDHDVFGDGSAVIVQAPGHTPGHTVLLLRTANSGNVLLSGDMWHIAESRETRRVPTYNFDKAKTLASMDKVEALAAAHSAKVIRQHVPEDFDALPKFPAPLE
ncbi:MAG: N-acyl homoserine lactonase family protein [Hyphomonadaceae bacterium]|nr:N-acyl homoserine lactonase family protein [Hyphomonadaceae bacterium]